MLGRQSHMADCLKLAVSVAFAKQLKGLFASTSQVLAQVVSRVTLSKACLSPQLK